VEVQRKVAVIAVEIEEQTARHPRGCAQPHLREAVFVCVRNACITAENELGFTPAFEYREITINVANGLCIYMHNMYVNILTRR
jgi:hypothetical protein